MNQLHNIILLLALAAGPVSAETVNFDDCQPGSPPPGWTATQTGTGAAKWEVVPDDSAPSGPKVLRQSGVATFPVCIKDDVRIKDGFVQVKFKAVSGKEDKAAGVVWRCQDADNYYVARANAAENSVAIDYIIQGSRTQIQGVYIKVTPGVWHTLRVDFKTDRFIVSFDGKKVLRAVNAAFSQPGKVGLWTKADSVTLFDDFSYGP